MSDDSESTDGHKQLVDEARRQALQARSLYHGAKLQGNPNSIPADIQELLAQRALELYDTLWECKNQNEDIKTAWENSDVDKLKEWDNQTVEVEEPLPGDTVATETVQRSKLMTVDPRFLVALMKQLDALAAQLGFTSSVEEGRPLGKVGGEDMWAEEEGESA